MPDTTIPDTAVEAAAKADYEHVENAPWADAHPGDRADWLASARVALAAAWPHLAAKALREVADEWGALVVQGIPPVAGYMYLRRRADEHEAGQ